MISDYSDSIKRDLQRGCSELGATLGGIVGLRAKLPTRDRKHAVGSNFKIDMLQSGNSLVWRSFMLVLSSSIHCLFL